MLSYIAIIMLISVNLKTDDKEILINIESNFFAVPIEKGSTHTNTINIK